MVIILALAVKSDHKAGRVVLFTTCLHPARQIKAIKELLTRADDNEKKGGKEDHS